MFWIALAAPAWAGHWTLQTGTAIVGGEIPDGSYASFSPMVTADYTARLWIIEAWGGASASALIGSNGQRETAAAPLQAEAGLGLGGRAFSVGLYGSSGFGGAGGGLYTHFSFPGPGGMMGRWGFEGRTLAYPEQNATGVAILFRMESGRRHHEDEAPPPPEEGVHHEDPYAVAPEAPTTVVVVQDGAVGAAVIVTEGSAEATAVATAPE